VKTLLLLLDVLLRSDKDSAVHDRPPSIAEKGSV